MPTHRIKRDRIDPAIPEIAGKVEARFALQGRLLGYRSHQAIAFIRSEVESTGQSPSYAMIRDELGLCSNGKVHEVVVRLERRGLIYRDGEGRQRRIRLVAQ